ncbi:hypothetical protein Tco_0884676 [Tanacetum coccineum]
MTIYGRVMTFYQDKKAAGIGLVLWGDLKVLMDSPEVNDGSDVWKNQHTWNIQSWKLYSYSGYPKLDGFHLPYSWNEKWLVQEGTALGPNRLASPRVNGYLVKASSNPFTFYDSPLPGVNTPWDVMRIVCNPELMDVAEVVQSWYVVPTGRYVVPTGRVIATVSIKVPTGRYIVPAGYIISPGRVT